MADACNPVQRNLYPRRDGTRFTPEYQTGHGGSTYNDSLRKLSWSVPTDVTPIGQRSAGVQLPELEEVHQYKLGTHFLHPTQYNKMRHTDHLSFSKSMGTLGLGTLADPKNAVFDRLYVGSKSQASLGMRVPQGRMEMAGDIAFKNGSADDAVALYTKAIGQKPDLFKYEKRCVAYAELGRYRDALNDAQHILDHSDGATRGAALMRVKALKDFMKRMDNFEAGYHNATSTLICLLRPREHRQLVASHPSTFGRPSTVNTIGKGLTSSASMVSLLNWDTDGDGNIDLDELREHIGSLGHKMKATGKNAFDKGGERGVI